MATDASNADVMAGWERASFSAAGYARDVYRRGSGPAVIVVHEIPGITPRVVQFADDVVDRGFTVVMPSLVGTPGRAPSAAYLARSVARVCIAREFTTWALGQTSPIVAWLRALARSLHLELGGPGVGAVGMCFSGGFALGMMVDDTTVAPVLAQPSLPFARGAERSADLGLSPDDLATVVDRAASGCQVLGLWYDRDPLVGTRPQVLSDVLGSAFVAVPIPSVGDRDHSVLTEQRHDESVARVLEFLAARLH